MATFDEDYHHQKPLYSSNTWSSKSNTSKLRNRDRAPLLKHNSVDYKEACCLKSPSSTGDIHLSILDLQTLRRDSKVKELKLSETIRPPQQNVFKLHKPGFHISTERVWFPRTTSDTLRFEECSEESTTLGDEEVEVKLPCRSVSINVVGMPSADDNDEVNDAVRPHSPGLPCTNDFQETIQAGTAGGLLLTHPSDFVQEHNLLLNGGGDRLPPPVATRQLVTNYSHHSVQCDNSLVDQVDKLSPCCRYRKPAIVSLISVGLIMFITFLVLYWNYNETVHRRLTKKQSYILDHWGKGSPSAAETAVLDLEVEILKKQEREIKAKQVDDLLVIDGRPLNTAEPSLTTTTTEEEPPLTTTLRPLLILDNSRVD